MKGMHFRQQIYEISVEIFEEKRLPSRKGETILICPRVLYRPPATSINIHEGFSFPFFDVYIKNSFSYLLAISYNKAFLLFLLAKFLISLYSTWIIKIYFFLIIWFPN